MPAQSCEGNTRSLRPPVVDAQLSGSFAAGAHDGPIFVKLPGVEGARDAVVLYLAPRGHVRSLVRAPRGLHDELTGLCAPHGKGLAEARTCIVSSLPATTSSLWARAYHVFATIAGKLEPRRASNSLRRSAPSDMSSDVAIIEGLSQR